MIRKMVFQNPSAFFGVLGAILAIACKAIPTIAGVEPELQRLFDSLALLFGGVPTAALAISTLASTPATVAQKATEAALKAVRTVGTEAVGAAGDITVEGVGAATEAVTEVLGDSAEVVEATTGTVKRVVGALGGILG